MTRLIVIIAVFFATLGGTGVASAQDVKQPTEADANAAIAFTAEWIGNAGASAEADGSFGEAYKASSPTIQSMISWFPATSRVLKVGDAVLYRTNQIGVTALYTGLFESTNVVSRSQFVVEKLDNGTFMMVGFNPLELEVPQELVTTAIELGISDLGYSLKPTSVGTNDGVILIQLENLGSQDHAIGIYAGDPASILEAVAAQSAGVWPLVTRTIEPRTSTVVGLTGLMPGTYVITSPSWGKDTSKRFTTLVMK